MSTTHSSLHADHPLDQLAGQFEHWRQTRSHPSERIPQHLWDQAAALARVLPRSRVAQHLRISPSDLNKHMATRPEATPATPRTPPPFVEVSSIPLAHRLPRPWRSNSTARMGRTSACAAPSPRRPWSPWCGPFWRGHDDPTYPAKPYLFGHRTG
jgi:hypothetical protein